MNIIQKLAELTSKKQDYQSVARALEQLRNSGKPVTVKFSGDSRTYSSRITAFNHEHKVFVLDNIFPPAPGEAFKPGRTATITSTDNQKSISLESVCLEPLVKNQDMGYEMKVRSSLSVVEFGHDFDFGLHHVSHGKRATSVRKVVGF